MRPATPSPPTSWAKAPYIRELWVAGGEPWRIVGPGNTVGALDAGTAPTAESRVLIALAGAAAEAAIHGRDLERAWQEQAVGDLRIAIGLSRRAGPDALTQAKAKVKRMVSMGPFQRTVRSLAEELIQRGRLTGDQVRTHLAASGLIPTNASLAEELAIRAEALARLRA